MLGVVRSCQCQGAMDRIGMRLPTIITSIVIINELPPKTTRNQLNIYPMPTFKRTTERDIWGHIQFLANGLLCSS